jgi:hypothetical protein
MKDEKIKERLRLVRLLRRLVKGDCATADAEASCGCDVVHLAVSLGLAIRQDGRLAASAQAISYLRRAMAEREEEAFAAQHGEIEQVGMVVEGASQTVRRNLAESPLGAVARLKDRDGSAFLPSVAVEAGERLLSDFTRGQLQPKITASWEPRLSSRADGGRGGQADVADSAIDARRRFGAAVEAMGPELSVVAVDVCCFSKGLELVERERQWPARSAKLMLRTALLALGRHYDPPRPDPRRRSHSWGTDDYRPVL